VAGRALSPERKATPEPPPRREPPPLDDVVDVTVLRILESVARPEVLARPGLSLTVVPPDESRSAEFLQAVVKRLQASVLYAALCPRSKWTKVAISTGSPAPADAVAQSARQTRYLTPTRHVGFRGDGLLIPER